MGASKRASVKAVRPAAVTVALILAAAITIAACGSSSSSSSSSAGGGGASSAASTSSGSSGGGTKNPIVVGAAIAQTGLMSTYDVPPSQGEQLAIADLNKTGGLLGRKLVWTSEDTRTSIPQASIDATSLLGKNAELIITTNDFDYGSPAAIVADKAKVISFSEGAGSLSYTSSILPYGFTVGSPGETNGAGLAQYAVQTKGWKNGYFIYNTGLTFEEELCKGAAAAVTHDGGTNQGFATVQISDVNYSGQIAHIKALSPAPQAIYLCTPQPQLASMLRAFRAAGIKTPIFGEPGFDGTLWKSAVPDASNAYFPQYASIWGDDPNPAVNTLVKRLEAANGGAHLQSAYGVLGYALIQIWAAGVRKAGTTDGPAVTHALETMGPITSIVGPTLYSTHWHVAMDRYVTIMGITDGKTHFITRLQPSYVALNVLK
jgi:branched-chain amino acid transport system substrate-binding protein